MRDGKISEISKIYQDFKARLESIAGKKKSLLKSYRVKIEEVKIKEIEDTLENEVAR